MTHKPRIWRDIDKHPLPESVEIDVKLKCGSLLVRCFVGYGVVVFRGSIGSVDTIIPISSITQWRDAK